METHAWTELKLQKLRRQVTAFWLTDRHSADFGDVAHALAATDAQVDSKLAEVGRAEGTMPSRVVPGLFIPRGGATLLDVMKVHRMLHTGELMVPVHPPRNLWSPTLEDCVQAGCLRQPTSALVVPHVPSELLVPVRSVVPSELQVRPSDTTQSLVARISACKFLDDMHWYQTKRGRGVRVNASTMSQPRRASLSVRGAVGTEEEEYLYNYTAYGRPERDWRAHRMAPEIFDLGLQVWLQVFHYLPEGIARALPFNHVQILYYYEWFDGRMGQHRDNANKRQLVQHIQNLRDGKPSDGIIGHCASHGAENSQIPMTGTVVYTLGDGEMVLKMRFPPADNLTLNRKEYAIEPKFTCKLGPGTAFVLDVWDDMFFTHEAEFELRIEPMACAGESTCREAWAFRHMESLKVFGTEKASACGMVRTLDVCAKETERKAKKAKQKANERRKMVQRMF
jgi:hypothetical protein